MGINFLMYCFHLFNEEVAEIFRELCITIVLLLLTINYLYNTLMLSFEYVIVLW